jgi:hypothetical protein
MSGLSSASTFIKHLAGLLGALASYQNLPDRRSSTVGLRGRAKAVAA